MAEEIQVKALLFASYADAFGAAEVPLLLMAGSTVGDAVAAVRAKSPATIPARPLVALNERYASYGDALAHGDEIALIPPVAGGQVRAALVDRSIDVAALTAEVADPSCGAVSIFLGTVRNVNEGRAVTGIEYKAYEGMAVREMETILLRARDSFAVEHIVVEHRLGMLGLGDVSIAIVAAHPHRQQAMDATRYTIEEIKKTVPIWKLEHYADGTREWVDPTRGAPPVPPAHVAEVVG